MRAFARGRFRHCGGIILHVVIGAALISSVALFPLNTASAQRHVPTPSIDAGTMTFANDSLNYDLDPASDGLASTNNVLRNIYESLITLKGASLDSYVPALATSWSANADKSVWVFHLRHGVRFHTGRCCMTAEDVQYSLGRLVLTNMAESYVVARFITNPFQQIKILDPYTVEFDLGRSQPLFLGAISAVYSPLILDAHALKAHAKNHDWGHARATTHDLGTGPYQLQSWVPDQQAILTRFSSYWGGWSGPHFSTIVVRIVPADATRRELLERGQIDLTAGLTPQDNDALKKNPNVRVIASNGTEVDYLTMTEAGPLASPYARQALSYAFAYDAYVKGALRGYATRAYGPIPSQVLGYNPHMFHYQTNLAKARALLQKAGVKPGTTLTMMYALQGEGSFTIRAAGLILQAQLAQLGLSLKLREVSPAAFSNIWYGSEPASQRPNIVFNGWYPDYNDPYDMCEPLIDSASVGQAGNNGGLYHDKQVDALLAEMKHADRQSLIRDAYQLQDITGRLDPPAIWLDAPVQAIDTAGTLHGVVANPLAVGVFSFYPMHR